MARAARECWRRRVGSPAQHYARSGDQLPLAGRSGRAARTSSCSGPTLCQRLGDARQPLRLCRAAHSSRRGPCLRTRRPSALSLSSRDVDCIIVVSFIVWRTIGSEIVGRCCRGSASPLSPCCRGRRRRQLRKWSLKPHPRPSDPTAQGLCVGLRLTPACPGRRRWRS